MSTTPSNPLPGAVDPRPWDIIFTKGEGGSIFITVIQPSGKAEWVASSTTMLRQRGVSRVGKGDYQRADDFTMGRVFEKGQARHLIEKYLPELLQSSGQRLLLRGEFFYTESKDQPVIPMRKSRNA